MFESKGERSYKAIYEIRGAIDKLLVLEKLEDKGDPDIDPEKLRSEVVNHANELDHLVGAFDAEIHKSTMKTIRSVLQHVRSCMKGSNKEIDYLDLKDDLITVKNILIRDFSKD